MWEHWKKNRSESWWDTADVQAQETMSEGALTLAHSASYLSVIIIQVFDVKPKHAVWSSFPSVCKLYFSLVKFKKWRMKSEILDFKNCLVKLCSVLLWCVPVSVLSSLSHRSICVFLELRLRFNTGGLRRNFKCQTLNFLHSSVFVCTNLCLFWINLW